MADNDAIQVSGRPHSFVASTEGYSITYKAPASHESGAFALVGGKVVNCRCVCGRTSVSCNPVSIPEGLTSIWLEVTHPTQSSGFSITIKFGSNFANTDQKTYVKLYELTERETIDFRPVMVLPFYD